MGPVVVQALRNIFIDRANSVKAPAASWLLHMSAIRYLSGFLAIRQVPVCTSRLLEGLGMTPEQSIATKQHNISQGEMVSLEEWSLRWPRLGAFCFMTKRGV